MEVYVRILGCVLRLSVGAAREGVPVEGVPVEGVLDEGEWVVDESATDVFDCYLAKLDELTRDDDER